jgi:hypothetical protein
MVIEKLHVMNGALRPTKNDAPLFIDANTVKAAPLAPKRLKSIAGWGTEVG